MVLLHIIYLQLVELEQVAVTSEIVQQASLLRPPLRASSGRGVDLRGNAHTLRRQRGVRRAHPQQVHTRVLLHKPSHSIHPAHLRVNRRLLRLQPCTLKVLDLVLLVDLVVSLASCAAGRVIPHAVISPFLLHSGDAGRCGEVKEGTKNALKTTLISPQHFCTSSTTFVMFPFSPPEGAAVQYN